MKNKVTLATFLLLMACSLPASAGAVKEAVETAKEVVELTKEANEAVSAMIDRHFDAKDQEFANRTGVTIEYPDRGVVIRPQVDSKPEVPPGLDKY